MKSRLSLLLLLGAILGLFGQEAVFARAVSFEPVHQTAPVTVQGMSADCADMMGFAKPAPPATDKPCAGKSPDCMAKMGCAVPVALLPQHESDAVVRVDRAVPRARAAARLTGRDFVPEPDPPTNVAYVAVYLDL